MGFNALVLAGSRPGGDPLSGVEGKSAKALIEIGGIAMLARVAGALRAAGAAQIGVSCSDPHVAKLAQELGCLVLPAAPGPSQSVAEAFDDLGAPLIVTTADHALLKADWVQDMIAGTPEGTDVSIMLANRASIDAAMPGTKRTYLKFADGHWSGCNLFYLRSAAARKAIDVWQTIEADRKRPWRIAQRLGWGSLLDYALGRLTMAEGIARLGARIGVKAALVVAKDGLAAIDVDKAQDLADIREYLA